MNWKFWKNVATSTAAPAGWFVDWVRGYNSESGVTVNAKTALNYAYVWQALNVIAGDLGQMPLEVFKETSDGRLRDNKHAAWSLLRHRPNAFMNASTFKETLQSHALMWGNGRAGITRDTRGAPIALVPFLPDRSYSQLVSGQLWHYTRLGQDTNYTPFRDRDVLHIKGLGFDGVQGYSVLTLARDSWGLGLAAEKHGSRTFKNGARPSVILESDGAFSPDHAKQLLIDWQNMHAGLDNVGRTALLQRGVKAKLLSGMSNADAQWLELRKFQRSEVASWFMLPPHKLGDDTRTGYNSLEQENQSYIQTTLMRWIVAWQEECREKLLAEKEKAKESHCIEFDTTTLLRGDLLSRYRAYQIGIASEFLCPDEVREFENMNKRPDGEGGVFENPNTKAAPTAATEPTDDPAAPAATPADQYGKEIAQARIAEMIGVEVNRVKSAAAKPNSFNAWLDKFYPAWEERFAKLLVSLGGDAAAAQEYCEQSKSDLLEQTGKSTAATLAADVGELVHHWPARAETLVNWSLAL
jgi:HK97 family phage portal protein